MTFDRSSATSRRLRPSATCGRTFKFSDPVKISQEQSGTLGNQRQGTGVSSVEERKMTAKVSLRMLRFDGISHELFHWFSDWESDEAGLLFCRLQIDSGVGEPTMVDLKKPSHNILPFTGEPKVIEVLERLHNSYGGLSARDALSGPDQAVLAAVEITLKLLARAS